MLRIMGRKAIPLLAVVLVVGTASAALKTWQDFAAYRGMDGTAKQYLDRIDALVALSSLDTAGKKEVTDLTADLKKNWHQGHTKDESWARIVLAYRLASTSNWTWCKKELETPRSGTGAGWPAHTPNPAPSAGNTVSVMLGSIYSATLVNPNMGQQTRTKLQGLTKPVNLSQPHGTRQLDPNDQHSWAQSYARVLLAFHIAATANTDAAWQRVVAELDHPQPSLAEDGKK